MREARDVIDYLSVHFYEHLDLANDPGYLNLQAMSASTRVEQMLSATWERIRSVQPKSRKVTLCFDEWNLVKEAKSGSYAGQRPEFALREGLFAAGVFHALNRLGEEVPIANLAMLVNVMGAFRANRTSVLATPEALAFRLYAENSGTFHVPTACKSPPLASLTPDTPLVDADATLSSDRSILYVTLVNRHPHREVAVKIDTGGFPAKRAHVSRLTAESLSASTTFEAPGSARIVTEKAGWSPRQVLPPRSVTALRLTE